MPDSYLNGIKKVIVNDDIIKNLKTEDDFMCLGVELAKEVALPLCIISEQAIKDFDKEEAILFGMLTRLRKLFTAIMDNICQKRYEIVAILSRCFIETAINFKYLIKHSDSDNFENFIKYSLFTEKKFLEHIEKNIGERGYEANIETRTKQSIGRAFEKSSIDMEDLNSKKMNSWAENNIYERFKAVDNSRLYQAFALQSHSIHGNWQDLLTYHLKETNGKYTTNQNWYKPSFQCLNPLCLIIVDILKLFVDFYFEKNEDTNNLMNELDDLKKRIVSLETAHENYLRNRASEESKGLELSEKATKH